MASCPVSLYLLDIRVSGRSLARLIRAKCYTRLKKHLKAMSDIELVLKNSKDQSRRRDAYELSGWLYYVNGKYMHAVQNLTAAIQLYRRDSWVLWMARGDSYKSLVQFDRALSDLNRAEQLEKGEYKIYLIRGEILYRKAFNKKANVDLTKAIELNPVCDEAYRLRSKSYEELGQRQKARNDARRAEELRKAPPGNFSGATVSKGSPRASH